MRFTVAIPAYKAKFLKECIDSILCQTFEDFELVIVNDASPENLDSIVYNYSDDRIRYYSNEHNFGALHVVDNWNKCLSYSNGDFVILIGDDDKLCSNCLEVFNDLINIYPNHYVYHCRAFIIDQYSKPIGLTETRPIRESVLDSIWHRITIKRTQYIADFVYDRKKLKSQGGFYKLPMAWASDDISAYLAGVPNGIIHTDIPLIEYRRNPLNISSSTSNIPNKMEAIEMECMWIRDFLALDPSSDKVDKILKEMISKHLPKYQMKKKIYAISNTFEKNKLVNLWYWINNREKYSLSFLMIIYSFFESIKRSKAKKIIS